MVTLYDNKNKVVSPFCNLQQYKLDPIFQYIDQHFSKKEMSLLIEITGKTDGKSTTLAYVDFKNLGHQIVKL